MIRKVILDFDGVMTDTLIESVPVLEEWRRLFSEKTGVPLEELLSVEENVAKRIRADSEAGWEKDGQIIAPAWADPYVFNTTVYVELIRQMRGKGDSIPDDDSAGMDLLHEIFDATYGNQDIAFRDGAFDFLRELSSLASVTIVTNSNPDKVKSKLEALQDEHPECPDLLSQIEIIGYAKKYVNNPEFTDVQESITLEGLERPVLLRRRLYKEILDAAAPCPEETVVIGDIFELDLAMPLTLGYQSVLLVTEGAHQIEIDYLNSIPSGHVASDYEEILALF